MSDWRLLLLELAPNTIDYSIDITLLPDRDPLNRTQTATINIFNGKTAIQVSYNTDKVYGFIFDVKLAVERDRGTNVYIFVNHCGLSRRLILENAIV